MMAAGTRRAQAAGTRRKRARAPLAPARPGRAGGAPRNNLAAGAAPCCSNPPAHQALPRARGRGGPGGQPGWGARGRAGDRWRLPATASPRWSEIGSANPRSARIAGQDGLAGLGARSSSTGDEVTASTKGRREYHPPRARGSCRTRFSLFLFFCTPSTSSRVRYHMTRRCSCTGRPSARPWTEAIAGT